MTIKQTNLSTYHNQILPYNLFEFLIHHIVGIRCHDGKIDEPVVDKVTCHLEDLIVIKGFAESFLPASRSVNVRKTRNIK